MPSYSETRILPYSPAQLFALVMDIEHYPEFLPWCRAARVVSKEGENFLGELIVSFSHITERYTSRVMPVAPQSSSPHRGEGVIEGEGTIEVELVSGPFKYLNNHWRFIPHGQGTEIHFAVDFEFKSRLLNSLIGGLFTKASEKMVSAFMKRAVALYGAS